MTQEEDFVRDFACRSHQTRSFARLVNFSARQVANARRTFADEMQDDETPLVFFDRSLFSSGKSGLLITDRAVYCSPPKRRIPLVQIYTASVERPTFRQQLRRMQVPGMRRVFINGEFFFAAGPCAGATARSLYFCAHLLEALGDFRSRGIADPVRDYSCQDQP